MIKKFRFALMLGLISLIQNGHNLFAMANRPNADPNAPPPPAWVQFFPFVVMILVFYVLLIRPQLKQKKSQQQLISNLKKGDKVVTTSGFIGTIVNIGPTTMEIKLNEETKVKVLRSAVTELYIEPAETNSPTTGTSNS